MLLIESAQFSALQMAQKGWASAGLIQGSRLQHVQNLSDANLSDVQALVLDVLNALMAPATCNQLCRIARPEIHMQAIFRSGHLQGPTLVGALCETRPVATAALSCAAASD